MTYEYTLFPIVYSEYHERAHCSCLKCLRQTRPSSPPLSFHVRQSHTETPNLTGKKTCKLHQRFSENWYGKRYNRRQYE